ncbi:MAG: hypothetical protein QOI65_82 [Thermoleophilaceae bacterium]|nr:hypothetical protein [Thermoleophilaceae bacterium]
MSRLERLPRWALPVLLFAVAALLSGVTVLNGIQPNDEGLMLQAARRIAAGQVPYSDFWWYYPPGQPYLLGGVWKLFGPSLLEWRVVRVLSDATVAVLAYELARRRAGVPLALAAWLAAACAMAFPTGPHPFPIALALALGALLSFERRPLLAGVLAGACAAWRIEFAGYLAVAVALAHLLAVDPLRERLRRVARFAAGAVVAALVLFGPVVADAGLSRSWEMLVRYPLVDFQKYQSLPFPYRFQGTVDVERVVHFYLPLALLVGLAGSLAWLAARFRRDDAAPVAVGVFAIGMAHYLLVRTDLFHTAPLTVLVVVLAAWALADVSAKRRAAAGRRPALRRLVAVAGAAGAALGLAWALAEGIDRRVLGLEENTVALHLPIADGVRTRPLRAAALTRAVNYVRRRVPPGQPIYVTGARADLVTSGNPLFYVLAGRRNATRYDIAAPGVVTSAPVQREIVRDLRRTRPRLILRWTAPVTALPEPNRAGRSSGVRILDDYLAREYHLERQFGYYSLLAPG